MSTRGPESGAGWSDSGPEPDGGAHEQAFATPAATRYELHDLVGSGGTAEVHLAFDRRLGREVALKRLAGNDADGSAARLEREAWMTARLEHPGIVPVYDAGCGPDGRRFYAMRLVRGQSFGDVLAATTTPQQRLALLRRFLAVCHAIAFAHDRRIVHRDLKPANLMLGEFGDTVVVDWGLAIDLTRDSRTAIAVGTPGYMAPEQARGEPVSERTDVWALGAILSELLTGTPLISARTAAESETRARELHRPLGDELPAELRAVASKAIAFDPAARYPSAGALAADLEAFLDGRRVGAHEYSALELLRRAAWAWRWPLAALATGLIITAIAVGLTWRRVLDERQRAVTAEARTRSALEVERASAARALVSRAVLAHELGSPAVAETLAATALVNDEAPDARGVLAGAHAGPRPAHGVRDLFAPCQRWWDATADARLCLDTAGGNSVFRLDGGVSWRNEEPWADAVFVAGHVAALRAPRGLLLLDAIDGGIVLESDATVPSKGLQVSAGGFFVGAYTPSGDVVVMNVRERSLHRHPRPCEQQSIDAFTLSTEALIAACSDERVVVRALDDGHVVSNFPVPFGPPHKGVMTAALDATGRQLALGGVDGTLFTIDLRTGAHLGVSVADEPLVRTSWHGAQLIIGLDRGGSLLWDPALARPVLHLPSDVVRSTGPNELRGWGRARWTWQLSTLAPSRYLSASGLSHVSVSPDGTKVAGAGGDGTVTLWARDDARVLQRLDVPGGVAKRAVFSPDGTRLAVATAGPTGTVAVFDTTTWARVAWEPGRSSRRVFFLHDGRLVALPYGDGVDLWSLDGRRSTVPLPRVIDAALGAPRDGLWLLTEDERLLTWNGEESFVRRQTPGALMLAVSSDGDVAAVARLDQVEVFVPNESAPRIFRAKSGEVVDVAIDTTSRWVVAGTRAGTSDVWELSTGRYVAALRGHTQRASGAAFSKDGLLFTSSWDGSVRTWDLSVLAQAAPRLLERADEAWALPLDDALDDGLLRPR